MPGIESLTEVLVEELRDLYDAEKRLTKAIPRMARKSANRTLRKAFNDHLKETNRQVRRLEQAFRHLGEKPRGKACAGMRGIVDMAGIDLALGLTEPAQLAATGEIEQPGQQAGFTGTPKQVRTQHAGGEVRAVGGKHALLGQRLGVRIGRAPLRRIGLALVGVLEVGLADHHIRA